MQILNFTQFGWLHRAKPFVCVVPGESVPPKVAFVCEHKFENFQSNICRVGGRYTVSKIASPNFSRCRTVAMHSNDLVLCVPSLQIPNSKGGWLKRTQSFCFNSSPDGWGLKFSTLLDDENAAAHFPPPSVSSQHCHTTPHHTLATLVNGKWAFPRPITRFWLCSAKRALMMLQLYSAASAHRISRHTHPLMGVEGCLFQAELPTL